MKRQMEFEVPSAAAGSPLADFLAARFSYLDRGGWCERIDQGRVTVNGRKASPEMPLRTGDRLEYDPSGIPEPPVDFHIGIVQEDHELLLVNKSGDLPCHPGGRYFNNTLWAWLKSEHGLNDFALVNRLDRETSGLVVIAKTPDAALNCRKQFAGRSVRKRYHALVESACFPLETAAAGWMAADMNSAVRKKRIFIPENAAGQPPFPDAERAETRFHLICQQQETALIRAEPLTGRLHQIRATLLALGAPIAGDKLYGRDETLFLRFCCGGLTDSDRKLLRIGRQALHASGLSFRHPKYGRPLEIDIDLPEDMSRLLEKL